MSLGAALTNALSGLHVATKSTELISSNISNALTPNYAKRSLAVSTRAGEHGGATIDAIQRKENNAILRDLRRSTAQLSKDQTQADFAQSLSRLTGDTTSDYSLGSRLNAFRNAIIEAAGQPDDPQRLSRAASAAERYAKGVSTAAQGIKELQSQTKKSLENDLRDVNKTLTALQKVNNAIGSTTRKNGHYAGLLDQRDQLLATLSDAVEFKIYDRENGKIAVYTPEGTALLETRASQITLSHDTQSDVLSFVVNGQSETTFPTGRIGGLAQIYNSDSQTALNNLDQLAAKLASEFSVIDQSIAPTDQGLFQFDSGIGAQSLRIHPAAASDPWRLADGLQAATQSANPNNEILNAMVRLLSSDAVISSQTRNVMTQADANAAQADENLARAQASNYELTLLYQADGVNTDEEMQHLLVVEQSYAANAKIIEVVDNLFAQLMRIGQ